MVVFVWKSQLKARLLQQQSEQWSHFLSLIPHSKKSPYFSEQIKNIIAVMDSFTSHYDFVYFLGFFRVCVDCLQLLRLYMFTLPNAYCIKSVFYSNYLYFITFQYTAVSALGNCLFQNQQWLLGYLTMVKSFKGR